MDIHLYHRYSMSKKQPFSLLLVEDDPDIAEMLSAFFTLNGIQTALAVDGGKALEMVQSFKPDIIVLDVILPYMDGLSVLDTLRADSIETPVILLSKKDTVEEKLAGFKFGADDYVTKPFSPRELLARIQAILRRRLQETTGKQQVIRIGGLTIDPETREVYLAGISYLPLTKTEFDLLYFLADRRNMAVTRAEILMKVLGYNPASRTKALAMHITNLRRKFERHGVQTITFQAVAGVGYKLVSDSSVPDALEKSPSEMRPSYPKIHFPPVDGDLQKNRADGHVSET